MQGHELEPFVQALQRTFGARPEHNQYSLVGRDDEQATVTWFAMITDEVLLGDAARVADGATLHVDVQGRGGGPIPLMLEIVNAGLTIAGLWQAGATVHAAVDKGRFKARRQVAQQWVDAGTDTPPSLALCQYVREHAVWERSSFDRAFALDRERGSRLLRTLGYRRTADSVEKWAEHIPDDVTPNWGFVAPVN